MTRRMKMQKGKYVGAIFTDDQKKARRLWGLANEREVKISEAIRTTNMLTRTQAHARLDMIYDHIEKMRAEAQDLFSDVRDSFTIASGRL